MILKSTIIFLEYNEFHFRLKGDIIWIKEYLFWENIKKNRMLNERIQFFSSDAWKLFKKFRITLSSTGIRKKCLKNVRDDNYKNIGLNIIYVGMISTKNLKLG